MFYGINTLVVANDLHLICALDPDWPGSSHDAHIWRESIFKPLLIQIAGFYWQETRRSQSLMC